ncbi:MAG: hypothetical protein PHS41_09115, partial [Victivallaceae bacterium]|nr:hypothetical protein [Victivallaceae bacterium]
MNIFSDSVLKTFRACPKAYPAEVTCWPTVQEGFLDGVPWRGRPTRFYACWSLPQGASPENPAPGIVLVHGGGSSALPDWVDLWSKRGYAAISMDNCGGVPAWAACKCYRTNWPRHEYSGPAGWG